jgi:hypothetical protein
VGQRLAGTAGLSSKPSRLNIVDADPGIVKSLMASLYQQVSKTRFPACPESGAAHTNYRNLIFKALHFLSLLLM